MESGIYDNDSRGYYYEHFENYEIYRQQSSSIKKSTIKRKKAIQDIHRNRRVWGVKVKKIGSVYRVFMSKERYNKRWEKPSSDSWRK